MMTEQAYKEMVERMRPRLMQMGREFFGSDTEAEEVVQETCIRAWNVRNKATLTDAYLMRIARNCCVSMWRGQRVEVELADDSHAAITEVTPQEEVEERENSEWLRGRLRRLPKAEREVWQLFYDEGLTVEEIAEARGISVASVRNTISSVRNTLRTALRRRFFDMRHLIVFALLALVSGIAVAAIIHPNGMVRGAIEHVLGIPKDTTVYRVVEVMPSYPGDMEAFYKFLAQQMHYPKEALENGIEGRVVVSFVVEEDGRLTHFEAVSSPSPLLSNEAIRVLRQMPRWNPAKRMGRNVRCQYNIPVMFRLK
ncbi:TonB family protein [Hallella faecis]|uniref:TonB family protein n=1 Tax=Hallella faecis TaxID=2841596 RepID=A0ABV1FTD2_9BACT|nr:TonB family protein [Hallella faecis]MBU0290913.1 TonB family protein [Hallella faecis]